MSDFDQTMQLGPYPAGRRQARVLSSEDTVHLLFVEGFLNVTTFMTSSEAGELAEMLMAAARHAAAEAEPTKAAA